jgi:hypothetical protein
MFNNWWIAPQDSLDSVSPAADHSFKPMPSPRVGRSWRPAATTTSQGGKLPSPTLAASAAYPSAISDRYSQPQQQQERRPSFEQLRHQHQQQQQQQYPHFDLYQPSPMMYRSSAKSNSAGGNNSGRAATATSAGAYSSSPYIGQTTSRGAIHQLLNIILKLRILVLLSLSTLPCVVKVKNYS